MRRLLLGCLLLSSCRYYYVENVYCDGTQQYACNDPLRPVCNKILNVCTGPSDGGADSGAPVACTQATATTDCPTTAPVCGDQGFCRPCNSASDDPVCQSRSSSTPLCATGGTSIGQCVACRANGDCSGTTPICTNAGTCRPCTAHTDCASGACALDGTSAGSCVDPTNITYVDNNPAKCTGGTGTPTMPLCNLQNGVDAGRPYVVVTGHLGMPYGKVSITTSKAITIIGPGQGSPQPATIYDTSSNDQFSVNAGAGVTISATVDGIEIGDRATTTLQNGAYCNASGGASAKIVIRRSAVQHSGKVGVTASGCDVVMDSDVVAYNTGGGLSLANTDFTVENAVLVLNGGAASLLGGVQVSGSGATNRAQLINLTIADNTAKNITGVYSGLDCIGGAAPVVFNSVVVSNSNAQINPNCTLAYSSFPGGTATNTDLANCSSSTLFVGSGANPYQPKSTATAPCAVTLLGKGTNSYMSVPAPDHDLTGAPRPQPAGSMPDDGAYEVP
jgi:hypothetical protein